jgi:hypothetical protein
MSKTIASFLLFVFFTQTVLAGIDIHNDPQNDDPIDILEHYIDEHTSASLCETNSSGDPHDITSHNDHDEHHHSCHGHTTSFPFSSFTLPNLISNPFNSNFFYQFIDHSAVLSTALRPPIAS